MAHYAVHLSGHYSKFDLDLAALLKLEHFEHLARLDQHWTKIIRFFFIIVIEMQFNFFLL